MKGNIKLLGATVPIHLRSWQFPLITSVSKDIALKKNFFFNFGCTTQPVGSQFPNQRSNLAPPSLEAQSPDWTARGVPRQSLDLSPFLHSQLKQSKKHVHKPCYCYTPNDNLLREDPNFYIHPPIPNRTFSFLVALLLNLRLLSCSLYQYFWMINNNYIYIYI